MFERKATGITLEADGTVRVVELTATVRTVSLSRTETFSAEGNDSFSSWLNALERAKQSGFDIDSPVVGITDSLTYRKVMQFPFRSRKRITQILESQLEGEIPVPSETVVADFLPGSRVEKGTTGIVLACSKQTVSRILEAFGGGARLRGMQTLSTGLAASCRAAGITQGVAVYTGEKEAVLVQISARSSISIRRLTATGDRDNDVRSIAAAVMDMAGDEDDVILACPTDIASAIRDVPGMVEFSVKRFSDLSINRMTSEINEGINEYAVAFGLALRGLGWRESIGLDFRQGQFGQVTPLSNLKGPIKRTSAMGIVVLLFLVAGLFIQTGKVKGEYERYSNQLETEFREYFPDIQYRRNAAVEIVRQRLDNLQGRMEDLSGFEGTGVLMVLSKLSSAVPPEINMKIDELSYDSKKLRIEGTVSSFDAVDKVKSALDQEAFFSEVQVQNARIGADVNKINFRLQMEVR